MRSFLNAEYGISYCWFRNAFSEVSFPFAFRRRFHLPAFSVTRHPKRISSSSNNAIIRISAFVYKVNV